MNSYVTLGNKIHIKEKNIKQFIFFWTEIEFVDTFDFIVSSRYLVHGIHCYLKNHYLFIFCQNWRNMVNSEIYHLYLKKDEQEYSEKVEWILTDDDYWNNHTKVRSTSTSYTASISISTAQVSASAEQISAAAASNITTHGLVVLNLGVLRLHVPRLDVLGVLLIP